MRPVDWLEEAVFVKRRLFDSTLKYTVKPPDILFITIPYSSGSGQETPKGFSLGWYGEGGKNKLAKLEADL